jgi:protoheme IX farnesyltransferase
MAACLLGIALVIGSACVINNFIDRDIDRHMARTNKRALALGIISGRSALTYAAVLGLAGFALLFVGTNTLTTSLGLIGFIVYVGLYGYAKRRSVHGTLVGSVSGAIPIVVGYCAATGRFDLGAMLLFLILVIWQMQHFYAIAIFRQDDYAAANIPVLPIVHGRRNTKIQMLCYIAAFMVTCIALTMAGYTGYIFLFLMMIVGLMWVYRSVLGFKAVDDQIWAKGLFRFSLIVLVIFSVLISIDHFLPIIILSG